MTRWLPQEVTETLKKTRRIHHGAAFNICVAPQQKERARLLVVTSRKVGNAVERNLLRRRIKALFYEEKTYLKGFDWIIFCKKEATKLYFPDLKKILLGCSRALSDGS